MYMAIEVGDLRHPYGPLSTEPGIGPEALPVVAQKSQRKKSVVKTAISPLPEIVPYFLVFSFVS